MKGDNRCRGHFTIDTSMRPHLFETHYVGISDGETEYSVEIPAKLKKKMFALYKREGIPNYIDQIHCVAIVYCITAVYAKLISAAICTDISKSNMHNFLSKFLDRQAYYKILKEKAPEKSNAHYYVERIRKRGRSSLILNESHLNRFIRLKRK